MNPADDGHHVYRRHFDPKARTSLSVLAALVAPGSLVLDLGTGSGALGHHLHETARCAVDGVTLSADEQATARPWYDRLELLDLEDPSWMQSFAERRYDAIVCADVLEHLREPERVLQACRTLLRPDGRLLVSIPNVAYAGMTVALMHGDWKYGPEGLLDSTHLRFYTRRSFTRLLEAEGWHVERVEAIDHSWYYTEFWTPFDHLPPAVARYLLAQPDASAYQLVFAARPMQAATRPPAANVPAPDPSVAVAVYTATVHAVGSEGAGPTPSVHALGRIGAEAQTLAFTIPAAWAPLAGLRLDPADRPGLMRLQSMVLRDAAGEPVWHWHAAVDGAAPLRASRHAQIEFADAPAAAAGWPLALLGDDPQIELPLPPGALAGTGPWRLEVVCGWPLSADYLALLERVKPAERPRDEVVEIVLPVYGSLDLVRRCLASLFDARCSTPWHLTIIDDASPQPEVGPWLREFALAHPQVTVVANARNLGFVATANLGMRLAGRRDVVLLNSDTEVAGDWLDRLVRALRAEPKIGTVTPFSNNATICSYPRYCEDNPLPPGWTPGALDRLFAQANRGLTIDIPTAIGFCMLVRRDCLDEVGDFDEQTFGAGYGEENDFCVRATVHGWRHLHALDVFVYHAGAASFSDSRHELQRTALEAIRRLHPHYEDMVREFVQCDTARPFREAVDRLRAEQEAGAPSATPPDAAAAPLAGAAEQPQA